MNTKLTKSTILLDLLLQSGFKETGDKKLLILPATFTLESILTKKECILVTSDEYLLIICEIIDIVNDLCIIYKNNVSI